MTRKEWLFKAQGQVKLVDLLKLPTHIGCPFYDWPSGTMPDKFIFVRQIWLLFCIYDCFESFVLDLYVLVWIIFMLIQTSCTLRISDVTNSSKASANSSSNLLHGWNEKILTLTNNFNYKRSHKWLPLPY